MYLARREFGKPPRIYQLFGTESTPQAWLFDGRHPETGLPTTAAMRADVFNGVAAIGTTRGEAVANMRIAEEAAQYA